jgi:hypothetical protein
MFTHLNIKFLNYGLSGKYEMRGKLFRKLNEIYMVELYINKHNKNILKFIAKYFPYFRNAKSYTVDYAAEVRQIPWNILDDKDSQVYLHYRTVSFIF